MPAGKFFLKIVEHDLTGDDAVIRLIVTLLLPGLRTLWRDRCRFPSDILALMAAHALDFQMSRRFLLRDRIAQVLPEWEPSMTGYSSVLAMYAFGLEENGEYAPAERIARQALAIDPDHPGAIHVLAHVRSLTGPQTLGSSFAFRP